MALTEVGNSVRIRTVSQQYGQTQGEVVSKTYSYQSGKGQETVYYAKDYVEISKDCISSYTVPADVDNYEEIKNMLKAQSGGKIASLGNKMFYETREVMEDYYNGKLSRDEVKDIFKEYFYHYMGTSVEERKECGGEDTKENSCYRKQFVTSHLAGLYEYFSRANTRSAKVQNDSEGEALMESNGMRWNGTCYYNADWYYACEEMQELFRQTADELADEYGAEHVDFQYVEQNTRFKLDGGITYNGVWDAVKWSINDNGRVSGRFLDKNMVPPRGLVYCSSGFGWWDGKGDINGIRDEIQKRRKNDSSTLLLMAQVQPASAGGSLLLEPKNYSSSSDWRENDTYKSAVAFLKNFNMSWNYRGDRWELMYVG